MKIAGEDYQKLKQAIQKTLEKYGEQSHEYQSRGLSFQRYIWDVYHSSRFRVGDGIGLMGDINITACMDSHIETALKKIFRELQVNQW